VTPETVAHRFFVAATITPAVLVGARLFKSAA
jgi:hypothetical protein